MADIVVTEVTATSADARGGDLAFRLSVSVHALLEPWEFGTWVSEIVRFQCRVDDSWVDLKRFSSKPFALDGEATETSKKRAVYLEPVSGTMTWSQLKPLPGATMPDARASLHSVVQAARGLAGQPELRVEVELRPVAMAPATGQRPLQP